MADQEMPAAEKQICPKCNKERKAIICHRKEPMCEGCRRKIWRTEKAEQKDAVYAEINIAPSEADDAVAFWEHMDYMGQHLFSALMEVYSEMPDEFKEIDGGRLMLSVPVPKLLIESRSMKAWSRLEEKYPQVVSGICYMRDKAVVHACKHVWRDSMSPSSKYDTSGWHVCGMSVLFSKTGWLQITHLDAEKLDHQLFLPLPVSPGNTPTSMVYKGSMPSDAAARAFMENPVAIDLGSLSHYKVLLQNRASILDGLEPANEKGWAPGTLAWLRGGVAHAGPAHDTPRAVLFFVLTPHVSSGLFNPEGQWHSWSLISDVFLSGLQKRAPSYKDDKKKLERTLMRVVHDWGLDERVWKMSSFLKDYEHAMKIAQKTYKEPKGVEALKVLKRARK